MIAKKHIILFVCIVVVISAAGIISANNEAAKTVADIDVNEIDIQEELAEEIEVQEEANILDLEEDEQLEKQEDHNKSKSQSNSNKDPKPVNLPTYYIKVNNQANVVTIYKKDEDNNYTIPVKAMVCSVGAATPKSGVYTISARYRWLTLIGNVYGQYATRIVGSILFHSVPYLARDNSTLEYWEYDKLGQFASAGCVRLTVADAMWIFNNCGSGTKVEFYSDSNPGPLGKPNTKKISNAPDNLKNYDPTDPDSNNPWKNYKPAAENNTNTNTGSNTNTDTNTNVDTNTATNVNTDTNTNINTNTDSNTSTNTDTNTNTNTNTNTDTKPDANTDINTDVNDIDSI